MLEGWGDETSFAELCATVLEAGAAGTLGIIGQPAFGLYRLQNTRTKTGRTAG